MSKKKKGLYFIEQILDYQQYNGQKYYLVKWQGYNNRDCTWEKPEKIPNLPYFLSEYEQNVKNLGSNFYHVENDEPPMLEDFIGVPSQQKKSKLQDQVSILKQELNQVKKQQEDILQLVQTLPSEKKPLQPNQQQDSENIQDSISELSQKNTEVKQPNEGGFEYGDQLDKIGQAAQIKQTGIKMYYLLWQKRPNGIIPKNRWVNSEYLQKYDIKSLCYYLQKKLL
ncbi:unnamed protein product (macronuclear) [Paramecium tetraurelia]|uniref:Chromo domain-containing protein n=1 Tax=Paramecium tetraurelia TaxID=5888 RepID=A0BY16_PARTE|nr:uncharacterized protein GSPATT00033286001 [Paramecium tetraurelia]CAK63433.1 unnamed protein product [Paramecium tetraurelia]|eukprot:XP_001430831.1 hypothetical protein (macronuclear) [Paramecium tetraurelia strain d4-2]